MCSFRIVSLCVTPHTHLSILISFTSSRASCPLVVPRSLHQRPGQQRSMYLSFENERLPLQLVAMRLGSNVVLSTFRTEHVIRLSIVRLYRKCHISMVYSA